MAWTAPITAQSGSTLLASDFNASVRDNLLETGPAVATVAGRILVSTGLNSITERAVSSATVATSETTTSTSYVNLATTGPTVTVTTGSRALVLMSCEFRNSGLNTVRMSYAITGDTTLAADDDFSVSFLAGSVAGTQARIGHALMQSVTAGSNTFTAKYRVTAGTGTFLNRVLIVMAF